MRGPFRMSLDKTVLTPPARGSGLTPPAQGGFGKTFDTARRTKLLPPCIHFQASSISDKALGVSSRFGSHTRPRGVLSWAEAVAATRCMRGLIAPRFMASSIGDWNPTDGFASREHTRGKWCELRRS